MTATYGIPTVVTLEDTLTPTSSGWLLVIPEERKPRLYFASQEVLGTIPFHSERTDQ